jgi:hypothetical protein
MGMDRRADGRYPGAGLARGTTHRSRRAWDLYGVQPPRPQIAEPARVLALAPLDGLRR